MASPSNLNAAAALEEDFLLEVLGSLVRERSVNPGELEQGMASLVQAWLEPTGANVDVVEFAPGRPSVAAVLGNTGDGPRLVLNGHMDTVAIDAPALWESDPFEADVRGGFVYGRGACDMKGGLAVQIAVAHHLARAAHRMRGSLILQFAAGEERGEPGTLSMLKKGYVGDFGIVTEPTELRVAVAERGLCHFVISIRGRSIHASRSHLGVNPIEELPAVLEVLEEYDRHARSRSHPLLPGGCSTPTVLRAGVQDNAVADLCELTIDRRLLPGETVQGELDHLRDRLTQVRLRNHETRIDVALSGLPYEAAEIASDSSFAATVLGVVEEVTTRTGEIWGTPFASDVRNLVNDAGMEAVTFGPGNVAECHCANERVEISQLRDAARVVATVAERLLL